MTHPSIGIIGGSGLYDMAALTDRARVSLEAYALRPVTPRTKRDWYEPEL